jgi:hypothetical protein
MFIEYEMVKLKADIDNPPLKAGTQGVVLMVHDAQPPHYEIEFFNSEQKVSLGTATVSEEYLTRLETQ